MLDCLIVGGTIYDGTGSSPWLADIALRDGKIVGIGKISEPAARVIDATGYAVSPGFIDIHTHYDAQVMWDPALTPSSLHGVTTVIGGNCGFTIAPTDTSCSDYILRMLACVEGMPIAALQSAVEFRWGSFGDWLNQLDGQIAVNCGFLVGHSSVRRLVMGEAWRQAASATQIEEMAQIVNDSVASGALGFSSSWSEAHGDHLGNPVPSRFAEAGELIRLAGVLKSHPGTMLEFVPSMMPEFPEVSTNIMTDMALAAERPLNWNLVSVGTGVTEAQIESRLSSCDRAAARGAKLLALMLPTPQPVWINISMIGFNVFEEWRRVLALPLVEKMRALRDPSVRSILKQVLVGKNHRHIFQFHNMTIERVSTPELKHLEGRRLADIAAERGYEELDAFIDISVDDGLQTYFKNALVGVDDESWRLRAKLWNDPRVILGGSDAGAHIDTIDCFAFFTDLIGPSVRDRKLIRLEHAIHKLTDQPARFYGLHGRGRIAEGWHADIVVFDPATVGPEPVRVQSDMPSGELRLYAGATGVTHVLVGGTEIVSGGRYTGAKPGTVLRAGRDAVASA